MVILVTNDGQLLLHHRDDKPGVIYPGHWAGFGGGLEGEETPDEALVREMEEETGIVLTAGQAKVMGEIVDPEADGRIVTCFYLRGGIELADIDLQEGQGVGVFSYEELADLLVVPFVRQMIDEHLLGFLSLGEADTEP